MGLLLSLLRNTAEEDIFIDFQNVQPTEPEMKVYNNVNAVLERGQDILALMENYESCPDLVRAAMQNPSQETEQAAFVGLLDCVESIQTFYNFLQELENVVPPLLLALAEPSEEKKHTVDDQQALAKQLALIFDLALQFDWLRMNNAGLPNDFSFYRRLLPKFSKHPKVVVKEDEANAMAMFTAEHIPMMTSLSRATAAAVRNNTNVTTALAYMAKACYSMVKHHKFDNHNVNLLCMRAMTGAIVLFDHVDPQGAFHSKSPIPAKNCVTLLKSEFPSESALTNAIRFSSLHFDQAPKSFKALFD